MTLKQSRDFEKKIHGITRVIEGFDASVIHDARQPDPDAPRHTRQIDIVVRKGETERQIECRYRKDVQDVEFIETLIGRRESLRATEISGVSSSGFTELAIQKAAAKGISLFDLKDVVASQENALLYSTEIQLLELSECQMSLETCRYIEETEAMNKVARSGVLLQMHSALLSRADQDWQLWSTGIAVPCNVQYTSPSDVGDEILSARLSCIARAVSRSVKCEVLQAFGVPNTDIHARSELIGEYGSIGLRVITSLSRILFQFDMSNLKLPENTIFKSLVFDRGQYMIGVNAQCLFEIVNITEGLAGPCAGYVTINSASDTL